MGQSDNHNLKMSFIHLNLNHARIANSLLGEDVTNQKIEVVSINDPHTREGKIVGLPRQLQVFSKENSDTPPRAAILVKKGVKAMAKIVTRDLVMIQIEQTDRTLDVISIYCPPSEDILAQLRPLEAALLMDPNNGKIIMGDFNAKSSVWSPRSTDPRGEAVIDFCNIQDLSILNDENSIPSYASTIGESWIDLLLVKNLSNSDISGWTISDQITGSDHRQMRFELSSTEGRVQCSERWNISDVKIQEFNDLMTELIGLKDIHEGELVDMNQFVAEVDERILEICKRTRKKSYKSRGVRHAVWWNDGLRVMRSRVRALRRRFQAETEANIRNSKKIVYKRHLAKFKKEIINTKKSHFQRFLDKVVIKTSFDTPYKLAKDKIRKVFSIGPVVDCNGALTRNLIDSEIEILKFHFGLIDDDFVSFPLLDSGAPEKDISAYEVENTLRDMNPNKAPGPNGVGLDIYRAIFGSNKEWFVRVLNRCLSDGIFPSNWKLAKVVLIPKSGRDKSQCEAYRPICLLSTWGKIFDKIVSRRLTFFLEQNGLIDEKQFGFRRGKSTCDAAMTIVNKIRRNKEQGYLTCMISLDIKSAFSNVRRLDVLRLLRGFGTPGRLLRVVYSFLEERKYEKPDGTQGEYNLGVPQGSSLGPILWLIIANEALKLEFDEGVHLQAFADDFVLLIRARACYLFSELCNDPLEKLAGWARSFGLEFSLSKCAYTIFPIKGSIGRRPSIAMNGTSLKFQREIKYLGILFDYRLSWMPHLNEIKERVFKFEAKIKNMARPTWGLKPEVLKTIYLRATERLALYGSPVWYQDSARMLTKLNQIQRRSLLGISKCYKTVSNEALQILTGCVPLDLTAKMESDRFRLIHWGAPYCNAQTNFDGTNSYQKNSALEPPWTSRITWDSKPEETGWNGFTDGTRKDNRTGAAFIVYFGDSIEDSGMFRLSDNASSFDAEATAILKIIEWANENKIDRIDVHSDAKSVLTAIERRTHDNCLIQEIQQKVRHGFSRICLHWIRAHSGNVKNEAVDKLAKSVLDRDGVDCQISYSKRYISQVMRSETLERWTRRWENSFKGRRLRMFFPDPDPSRLNGDFFLNQVFTGHGAFAFHQSRFFGKDSTCHCGDDEGTVGHVVFRCPTFAQIRRDWFPRDYLRLELEKLLEDSKARRGVKEMMVELVKISCGSDERT